MRPSSIAATALTAVALVFLGSQIGEAPEDLTEYDAVYADGPYSHLPPDAQVQTTTAGAVSITEAEARAADDILDMLAGAPAQAPATDAPLDRKPISGTGLHVAGL